MVVFGGGFKRKIKCWMTKINANKTVFFPPLNCTFWEQGFKNDCFCVHHYFLKSLVYIVCIILRYIWLECTVFLFILFLHLRANGNIHTLIHNLIMLIIPFLWVIIIIILTIYKNTQNVQYVTQVSTFIHY